MDAVENLAKGSLLWKPSDIDTNLYFETTKVYDIEFSLSATDLRAADSNGKSDPYIVFKYQQSDVEYKTPVLKKDLNPVWPGTFKVPYSRNQKSPHLEFRIYDKDLVGKDFLGYVCLDVSKYISPFSTTLPPQNLSFTLLMDHLELDSKKSGSKSESKKAGQIKGFLHITNLIPHRMLWSSKEEVWRLQDESGITDEKLLIMLGTQYRELFPFTLAGTPLIPQAASLWAILQKTELGNYVIDVAKQVELPNFTPKEKEAVMNAELYNVLAEPLRVMFDVDSEDDNISIYDFVLTAARLMHGDKMEVATAWFKGFDVDHDGVWNRAEIESLAVAAITLQSITAQQKFEAANSAENNLPQAKIKEMKAKINKLYLSPVTINSRVEAMLKVMDNDKIGAVKQSDFLGWYCYSKGQDLLFDYTDCVIAALDELPNNQAQLDVKIQELLY